MAVEEYYSYDNEEDEVKKEVEEEEEEEEEEEDEEEDYIDMEVSSLSELFTVCKASSGEFEFQMSSSNVETESTTSPADELFYKGKLLPLQLPPRLQMVEKLLQDSPRRRNQAEFYSTPLGTNCATTPSQLTPFQSCNISPLHSSHVTVSPHDFVTPHQCNYKRFVTAHTLPNKSWTKKLKTKIKSLFAKSFNSNESSSAAKPKQEALKKETQQTDAKDGNICHRRSFSGAFKRRPTATKLSCSSSSASSSSSSSSVHDLQPLKRSSSVNSEMETSLVQGAIAHCKRSQQSFRMRKTFSEIGLHSFSSSRFPAFDDETTTPGLCRG